MSSIAHVFFRHNLWANLQLIEFCAKLDNAQLDPISPGTSGSVRNTLVHILRGEQWYVNLLSDREPERTLPDDFSGFEALHDFARWSGEALIDMAATMTGNHVRRDVPGGPPYTFQAAAVLLQALSHGAEHRGHVATVLSQHGINPPHLDGWAYAEAHGMIEGWRFYNDD
jgi:uncharacterized damage-inducible protein DinB